MYRHGYNIVIYGKVKLSLNFEAKGNKKDRKKSVFRFQQH